MSETPTHGNILERLTQAVEQLPTKLDRVADLLERWLDAQHAPLPMEIEIPPESEQLEVSDKLRELAADTPADESGFMPLPPIPGTESDIAFDLPVPRDAVPVVGTTPGSLASPNVAVAAPEGPVAPAVQPRTLVHKPDSARDERFMVERHLFRATAGLVIATLKPAQMDGDLVVQKGELIVSHTEKPKSFADFIEQEQAALCAELAVEHAPAYKFVESGRMELATADLLASRMRVHLTGLESSNEFDRAKAFAHLTQIIQNVTLLEPKEAASAWLYRQNQFTQAAQRFYLELKLTEIPAIVGQDYTRFSSTHLAIPNRVHTPTSATPRDRILQVLGRCLKYTPRDVVFKGTVLYQA